MTTLQELTEKIHKHCPELLELSFGCEVKVKYTNVNPRKVATGVFEVGDGKDLVYLASNVGGEGELVYVKRYDPSDNYIQEILGHPIILEHVLKAINVTDTGWGNSEYLLHNWQLTKPLSEQSEETIKWLNEIIV